MRLSGRGDKSAPWRGRGSEKSSILVWVELLQKYRAFLSGLNGVFYGESLDISHDWHESCLSGLQDNHTRRKKWKVSMFRITTSTHEQTTTIRVEGCLEGMSVLDFRRACHSAGTGVCLDLSGLVSADAAGISVLRSLRQEGVELRGATPYIRCLLEKEDASN